MRRPQFEIGLNNCPHPDGNQNSILPPSSSGDGSQLVKREAAARDHERPSQKWSRALAGTKAVLLLQTNEFSLPFSRITWVNRRNVRTDGSSTTPAPNSNSKFSDQAPQEGHAHSD